MILPNQTAPIARTGNGLLGLGQTLGVAPTGARAAKFWARCPAAGGDMLISKKKPTNPNAHILKTKFKCTAQTNWKKVATPIEGHPKVKDPIKLKEFDLHE